MGYGHARAVGDRDRARQEPEEYAAILALHREAGWPGTHVDGEVWAVRAGGNLVGGVQLLELAPALILIDAAVVRAGARGRGIGAEAMRAVMATRQAEWWLECRQERIALLRPARLSSRAEHLGAWHS